LLTDEKSRKKDDALVRLWLSALAWRGSPEKLGKGKKKEMLGERLPQVVWNAFWREGDSKKNCKFTNGRTLDAPV